MFEDITKRPSAKILILMNLVPLFGVVFWGWSVFNIVLLYWIENLVLGVINIMKMVTCRPDLDGMKAMATQRLQSGEVPQAEREKWQAKLESGGVDQLMTRGHSALKFFMIPFFTLHYFGFCAGHGIFVFTFFGKGQGNLSGSMGSVGFTSSFERIPAVLSGGFLLAAVGLVVSHLFSFFTNYIGRGEYKRTVVPLLMFRPYGRIVLLHVAIIFGGFAVMALGSPMLLLLILIVGKIIIDLLMHLKEHKKADVPVDPNSNSPLLRTIMRGM